MATKKRRRRKPEYEIARLEQEYTTLRPQLIQLDQEVDRQLGQLLHGTVPLAFPVQHRVKTWSSITEKLQRVPLSLKNLRDLQDLVGFRIVLQFRRDVERVCSLIATAFTVINRYDTAERLREDQFGYSSVHFVVELPEQWLAVPTMAGLADLRAEIQVRTTAQHIWAEASQTLQYKNERAVPLALKRAIYRVSALLESVDLEFERVLADRDNYKSEVARSEYRDDGLDVNTLEQVLDANWPKANKDHGEDYADLLNDLSAFDIMTPSPLRSLILKWHDVALASDAQYVAEARKNPEEIQEPERERIRSGVFFTHCGLTRVAIEQEWPDRWSTYSNAQERIVTRVP